MSASRSDKGWSVGTKDEPEADVDRDCRSSAGLDDDCCYTLAATEPPVEVVVVGRNQSC